jgi:hypothetical protein
MLVRELHLKDLALLESDAIRNFCIQLSSKRLAESVAAADAKGDAPERPLKRVRNESNTSLDSMTTQCETDAALRLAELCKCPR